MGVSFNQVVIAGGVTRDPELRHVGNGTSVCELSIAVSEKVKDRPEKTHYFDVVCWQRTAEVAAEYLKKGSQVLIGGRLEYSSWEKDGQKRSAVKIVCDRLQMLDSRKSDSDSRPSSYVRKAEQAVGGRAEPESGPSYDDDIPF